MHHYPKYHPPPTSHPILTNPHISTNGYNMPGFHLHTNSSFTSTFTAHHHTATQPISTTRSEDEFYIKQRYFQRM